MALKLLTLDEAARVLGVGVDELNRLRERREISGYRDGTGWKFKEQDLERLKERLGEADHRAEDAAADDDSASSLEFDFAVHDSQQVIDLPVDLVNDDAESDDIVLLSDLELGESGPSTSSTIIGKPGVQRPEESDIRI